MKTAAFAIALLMSGAAIAQTTQRDVDTSARTHSGMTATAPASGQLVQPGNSNPERDARGIAVISAPAVVPAGWNGTAATAVGGPLVDPGSGETIGRDSYPPCTASVTDNCVQTYERGRSAQ